MKSENPLHSKSGFTLIELLVVIAIIAILAVVVILTLNPTALLQESRDSNRLSDMQTITGAINLYNEDQGGSTGYSLSTPNVAYISIPDPTATTTAGTNCAALGFVSTASTTYHCAASSTYRNINGTGWIPIDFASTTVGSPLGSLPVDPINTTSSGEYYEYMTDGINFEIAGVPESQKYSSQPANFADGSSRTLITLASSTGGSGTITFTTSTYTVGSAPQAIAFDSNTKTIWVANTNSNTVTQISDTTPYASSTYTVGSGPQGIAFDSNTNTIWVANTNSNTVTQISDTTPYANSTYTVGSGPLAVAFDSNTKTIWVANTNSNTVTQISDTTPYASSTYTVGSHPSAIAFDSNTNTIWVANMNSNTVTQISDTTPYASSTYTVGSGPSAVAFDSHANTIWVANENDSTVTQISDTTPYASSTYVAIAPSPKGIFGIATAYAGGSGGGSTSPQAIAFDSNTNTIWVADGRTTTVTQFTPSR
jgi:prepilin-type N-terminal cleavage/methylation domain-containing protein